jgi:hypothetical protein
VTKIFEVTGLRVIITLFNILPLSEQKEPAVHILLSTDTSKSMYGKNTLNHVQRKTLERRNPVFISKTHLRICLKTEN